MGWLPPLLVALFAGWCGTFAAGADWPAAGVGWLALLALLGLSGGDFLDGLRLGKWGAWLPAAAALAITASLAASPVPRAGRAVVILLPAFYLLPGWVARCWRSETDRRWGLRGLSLVVGGLALASLLEAAALHARPALPLGQHNVLALWLVALLPPALLPLRERGGWRGVAGLCGLLGVIALVATGSRTGGLALLVEGSLAALVWGRGRRWVPAAVTVVLVLAFALSAPAWIRWAEGSDPSWNARLVYWRAALAGLEVRPALGWGPGSAPWMVGWFYRPIPGVSPSGEVVGDFHSLPLHLAFELGGLGLAAVLATGLWFFRRRIAELPRAVDPDCLRAGLLGAAGFAVASLGQAALAVAAIPVALAVVLGAALAGGRGERDPGRKSPARVYALAAALLLLPLELARRHYDRAAAGAGRGDLPAIHAELKAALALDPSFPLYRMHYALSAEPPMAHEALRAAEDGGGAGTLWLVAATLLERENDPEANRALAAACALVPFNGLPSFLQAVESPGSAWADRQAARALLAEPRLLAAVAWRERPELLARALGEIRRESGVDAGWREALLGAAASSDPAGDEGPPVRLGLEIDDDAEHSFSLYAFRRGALHVSWPVVDLRPSRLPPSTLPAAVDLPGTSPALFSPAGCRGGATPSDKNWKALIR